MNWKRLLKPPKNNGTVEPRFNKPPFNEVLNITNDTLRPGQNYSKMYGIEPRYNEFLDITNIIWKPKHKIYLDIMNYNVNMRQKINAEQSANPFILMPKRQQPFSQWLIIVDIGTALQAATILVQVEKIFGDQNSGESRQLATNRMKEKLT